MAENREERTPYLGLLALMASNAGGGPSPNAEGYGQPYWSPYALDAYLAALHDAPRVGTVLISPPGHEPLVALSAGDGAVRAGRTLEVAQTFVDEYGRETLPSTVASIYTGDPLADPDTAATLGTPYSSVVSGFTGGLLEVWYSWVDADAGETLVGPVASVELPYLASGTYNRVEVTLPESPTAAGAYGAFVYVRHGSSGNIVQAEQITGTDTTCVLVGTWINCFQSLPQFNTTNASNGLNISQDVSVTAPAEAVLTRFYLRAQGEAWYAGDRRLRIADVDEWDPTTVTYPLLYTGALAELAPGYPPTVEQVKAIRPVNLATEVTGELSAASMDAALARDAEVAALLGGPYVLSGLLVEAQASPDMTVKTSAGWAISDERIWNPAADTSIAIAAAHATLGRVDIVCVNASGAIVSSSEDATCKGTADAAPVAPSTPDHYVLLAAIDVPATDTTIGAAQITDSRDLFGTVKATLETHTGDSDFHFTGTEKADRLLSSGDKTDLTDAGTTTLHKHPGGIAFAFPGQLTAGDEVTLILPLAQTVISTWGKIYAATVPTGADLVIDILQNGTSIYATTTANRPTVTDADADGWGAVGEPDTVALSAGDRITAVVLAVGSTVAGSDVSLTLLTG